MQIQDTIVHHTSDCCSSEERAVLPVEKYCVENNDIRILNVVTNEGRGKHLGSNG